MNIDYMTPLEVETAKLRAAKLSEHFRKREDHRLNKLYRKRARTRIYSAVFGFGGQRDSNIPWLSDRAMNEQVNLSDIRDLIDLHWRDASFPLDTAQHIVERLNRLAKLNHSHPFGLSFVDANDFRIVPVTSSRSEA